MPAALSGPTAFQRRPSTIEETSENPVPDRWTHPSVNLDRLGESGRVQLAVC